MARMSSISRPRQIGNRMLVPMGKAVTKTGSQARPGTRGGEAPAGTPDEDRARGSALTKGMAVLDLVAGARRPIGLVELTERLGLPKPTVHRIVRQLEDEGLLRREPLRDRYGVGPRLCRLSVSALQASVGGGAVHAILEEVVDLIGETCNLGMLDRSEVVYADRVECNWPLRLQLQPNSRLPVHATANGKLLLAFLPEASRRRILANVELTEFTPNTITATDRLEAEFARIRERDYSVNDQEFHLGLIGLAVPVRDSSGRVLAGLAVHAPLPRLDVESALRHLPALRDAAARIGDAMEELTRG